MLLDHARQAGIRLVQVSTDEVYGDIPLDALAVHRGGAAPPVEPVLGVEDRRRPAGARLRAHLRRRRAASRAARTTTGRASTRRSSCRSSSRTRSTASRCRVYGDGRQRREWLHAEDYSLGDRARAARGAAGRGLQRRRPGAREHGGRAAGSSTSPAPRPTSSATSTTAPATTAATRVDSSKMRALGWTPSTRSTRAASRRPSTGTASNRDWWEPIKIAASTAPTTSSSTASVWRRRQGEVARPAAGRSPFRGRPPRGAVVRCRDGPAPRGSSGPRSARLCRRRLGGSQQHGAAHAAARVEPGTLVITGHGWGHGVGMSQWGAYGYALHGWDAEQILLHYYPGTDARHAPADARARAPRRRRRQRHARLGGALARRRRGGDEAEAPGRRPHASRVAEARRASTLVSPLTFRPGKAPVEVDGHAYRGSLTVDLRRHEAPGRERRPARVVPRGRGRRGGVAGLAAGRARGAGDRRPLVRARAAGASRRRRARSTSTPTAAARSTAASPPSRRRSPRP